MNRHIARLLVLGAFAAATALSSASPARAQGAPTTRNGTLPRLAGATPDGPSRCAFPFIVDADNLNLAYPDPNATYWAMPFSLDSGDSLLVHGTYPSARFMALTLYDLGGDTIAQLSDLDIAPDPGSANPYAVADPPPGSGRSWTIEVVPSGTTGSSGNVLSLDAGQRAGWVIYRVYLGNPPGDLAGGAPLPSVVQRRGARTSVLEPCTTFLPGTGIASLLRATLPEPVLVTGAPKFVRLANDSGLFANEANAYLTAFADASPGEILVVRGTLPTTPDTEAGQSVVGDFAMRYLSITSNLNEQPYPTVDGVYDHELPLDALGRYTVVVARDGDVPRNATAENDVAVLQWGNGNSQAVIIRNMLPSSAFPHAVQDVTPSSYGAPSDAEAVMGTYYPRIATCTKAKFEAEGADGCLADDQAADDQDADD